MDELDNDALPLLLILEDELFPQLLEWSASKGWSDLVIFLLETDYFRFKTNDQFEEQEFVKPSLYEAFHLIQKNSGGCFDAFMSQDMLNGLKRLLDSGIPLNSVYSQLCNSIWKELLRRGNEIVDSSFWPSVRRSIVENHEINLEDMLSDVAKRKYFDRYIQNEPADLLALQCLLSVRRILKALDRYKPCSHSNPTTPTSQAHGQTQVQSQKPTASRTSEFFGFFTGNSGEDGGSSIMRHWKASKNAVSSASKALQAPFAASTHSTHSGTAAVVQNCSHDYTDPFEAFKIVLEGTRQLQKQFFPSGTTVLSSGGGSAFSTYSTTSNTASSLYGAARLNSDSYRDTVGYAIGPLHGGTAAAGSGRAKGGGGGGIRGSIGRTGPLYNGGSTQKNCAGISEPLRIEIQSTLTVNASVRAREIDTVDRAFAFACANMLEKLLLSLEKEMLEYISEIFTEFVETTDYAIMVAHARTLQCKRIADYSNKLEFLYDRVRQQRIVSWKDSQTRGKVFVAYERLNAEGDDLATFSPPQSPHNIISPAPVSTGPSHTTGVGGTFYPSMASGVSALTRNSSIPSTNFTQENNGYLQQQQQPQQQQLQDDDVGDEGGTDGDQGKTSSARPYRPNVVAISLEIVLPHTTLLSASNVTACPHRVCLYAGGKRRAARIRRKVSSTNPAAAKNINMHHSTSSPRVCSTAAMLPPRATPPAQLVVSIPSSTYCSPRPASATSPLSTTGTPVQRSALASPSTKSPVRRASFVKFDLIDDAAAVSAESSMKSSVGLDIDAEGTNKDPATADSAGSSGADMPAIELGLQPAVGSRSTSTAVQEMKRSDDFDDPITKDSNVEAGLESAMKSSHKDYFSGSDNESENDTLSDLPLLGIAGSIKIRNISNASDIGKMGAGNDCFNDIVDDVKHPLGDLTADNSANDIHVDGIVEDDDEDESYSSSSDGSNSSSDYEGDVRHVYSNTDLDQLMRPGESPVEAAVGAAASDSPQITPRLSVRSRKNSAASSRVISRAASYASVGTAATGTSTAFTGRGMFDRLNSMAFDDGIRRLKAIDLVKLDRSLHKEVLGTSQVAVSALENNNSTSSGAQATRISQQQKQQPMRRINTKNMAASLAVALAGVKDGDDEQFGRKFLTSVEESFAFTTDTKGLGLLNDLLFTKHPSWHGPDQAISYIKSFETAISVFRQNAMLDTHRPLYRVCIQVVSEVIPPSEVARLKALFIAQDSDVRVNSSDKAVPKAPLHPGTQQQQQPHSHVLHHRHHHHSSAVKIPHSHVRIGVSFMLIDPTHTMLTGLECIAYSAFSAMLPPAGSIVSELSEDTEESKILTIQDPQLNAPLFPLKLHYTDYFHEFVRADRVNRDKQQNGDTAQSDANLESLYELYLGTHPGYAGCTSASSSPASAAARQSGRLGSVPALCEPISRHIGVCDFSMSEMLSTVSTRLMMQILMLVLVDRPIMLISTSSTLLSQVQAAIPRLIWPFRIESTHVIRQILSGAELHHFVYRHDVPFVTETLQPVIKEKKLNRKVSSWREMITRFATNVGTSLKGSSAGGGGGGGNPEAFSPGGGNLPVGMRSPRNSFTRSRKGGSTGDLLAGLLRRTANNGGTGGVGESYPGSNSSVVDSDGDGEMKSGENSPVNLAAVDSRGSPHAEPRSPYTRIVTPPSLQLPTPTPTSQLGEGDGEGGGMDVLVDQFSCILGVDANAFYSATPELRDELECMRIRGSGFTFIDIDSGLILNRRPDEFSSEDEADGPPKPLPSRLSDMEIFRIANFGIFRSLIKMVTRLNEELILFARNLDTPPARDDEEYGDGRGDGGSECERQSLEMHQITAALTLKIVSNNREIEKAFYGFWSEFVLRALPKCIQHFPGPKVISCDIRSMLTELLHTVVASSASYDMGEDYEDMLPVPGSAEFETMALQSCDSSDSSARMRDDLLSAHVAKQLPPLTVQQSEIYEYMNKMPFEEFLALFVEQVANHGETNMCYAFYKEFIADGSVVFKNLLLRHSAVLEKWRI